MPGVNRHKDQPGAQTRPRPTAIVERSNGMRDSVTQNLSREWERDPGANTPLPSLDELARLVEVRPPRRPSDVQWNGKVWLDVVGRRRPERA